MANAGVLILESGLTFEGTLFGAVTSAAQILERAPTYPGYGEAVFNTSLTGYQEILTDPSYFGQLICMTAPHIGNTGINTEDPESKRIWCSGLVVHEWSNEPSNWRSQSTLDEYLCKGGIPALSGIDTRALTRHLRSQGVTRALILPAQERDQAARLFAALPKFEGRDMIREVTTREAYRFEGAGTVAGGVETVTPQKRYRVVAVDFGAKTNLLRSLVAQGCDVEVLPATVTASEVLARKPDGIFLSNGPGDPAAAPYAAEMVRGVLGKVPLFGVCMGHQILALALGAKTYKLKFGHRGGNQPVIEKSTGQVEISSHNHGYAVDERSLPAEARVSHVNLNDRCVEGIEIPSQRAFSVQYHPEAAAGPHDSHYLFDKFLIAIKESRA